MKRQEPFSLISAMSQPPNLFERLNKLQLKPFEHCGSRTEDKCLEKQFAEHHTSILSTEFEVKLAAFTGSGIVAIASRMIQGHVCLSCNEPQSCWPQYAISLEETSISSFPHILLAEQLPLLSRCFVKQWSHIRI